MTLSTLPALSEPKPRHGWLKSANVFYAPGTLTPLLEETAQGILGEFRLLGHFVQETPSDDTTILLTTARYGENLNWRQAPMFTARARYKLGRQPTVYTLVHILPAELDDLLSHFEQALKKDPPAPEDFEFDGLSPQAYLVLTEQGRRGGPILSVLRLLQAQLKSIRILLVVGEEHPECVYHFDLVGAYPRSTADDPAAFYEDIALRMVTTVSTREVTHHEVVDGPLDYELWRQSGAAQAMRTAAQELGKRHFFTEMVRISDLVNVPAVGSSVASQYSEGCFGTWSPSLNGLVATITGSARPVDKDNITEDELVIISGVRPGGVGAFVRNVEGKRNDPPSSEAVEMIDMDAVLPTVFLDPAFGAAAEAPVVRSKLHGHRGIASYNPDRVEYVTLDPPYFHYIVSCATEAQAHGVKGAFSRSESLLNPEDGRQLAFTILPGHGLVIAEKWIPGKAPFQAIWEAMDAGDIVVESHVPQGPIEYVDSSAGNMVLREL